MKKWQERKQRRKIVLGFNAQRELNAIAVEETKGNRIVRKLDPTLHSLIEKRLIVGFPTVRLDMEKDPQKPSPQSAQAHSLEMTLRGWSYVNDPRVIALKKLSSPQLVTDETAGNTLRHYLRGLRRGVVL